MRRRGSITVFAALSLMMIAQLLFTLIEGARNLEYHKILTMNTDSVIESVFADYSQPLWENYRLLGFSVQDGDGEFSFNNREAMVRNITNCNLNSHKAEMISGVNLLSGSAADAFFYDYCLMTDADGKVFQAAVTKYMKNNMGYEAARGIHDHMETAKKMQEEHGNSGTAIDDALDALKNQQEDAKSSNSFKKASAKSPAKGKKKTSKEENLLTSVAETQKTGLLSLMLPEHAKISGVRLALERTVSHRTLEQGTASLHTKSSWYDRVLVNQYLISYMKDYTDGKEGHGLQYELEYLIGGRSSDEANLKVVIVELLASREAMNFASIVASSRRMGEAQAMAILIAGATANPAVIEAVKWGLVAAWAYAESVLDIRALLQGYKISLVKTDAEWTSELSNINQLLSGWSMSKENSAGLKYQEYLGILLYPHSDRTIAMRAMDVMESTVRSHEGYESFRMDALVCETSLSVNYEYSTIFLPFVDLLATGKRGFIIKKNTQYSYLERIV